MSEWIDIGRLDEIPRRGARLIKTPFGCIALFRTMNDRIFALDDACPHKKGPLSEGMVHGTSVTCPLHNWVIDLNTGKALGDDIGQVSTFATKIDGGRILLCIDDLAGRVTK